MAVGYTKGKLVTDAMMWFDKFSCKRSLTLSSQSDAIWWKRWKKRFKGKKVPKTVMIRYLD